MIPSRHSLAIALVIVQWCNWFFFPVPLARWLILAHGPYCICFISFVSGFAFLPLWPQMSRLHTWWTKYMVDIIRMWVTDNFHSDQVSHMHKAQFAFRNSAAFHPHSPAYWAGNLTASGAQAMCWFPQVWQSCLSILGSDDCSIHRKEDHAIW